jgi:hypothetical protein
MSRLDGNAAITPARLDEEFQDGNNRAGLPARRENDLVLRLAGVGQHKMNN